MYLLQLKWSKQLLSNEQQHWTLKYGLFMTKIKNISLNVSVFNSISVLTLTVFKIYCKYNKTTLQSQSGNILGNEKLLIIVSIAHYIGGVILCLIAIEINNGENGLLYDLIIILDGFIIAIPFCILSFVSQKFHDNLGVRDEIRGIAIIFAIGVLGFVVGGVVSKDTIVRSQGSYAWVAFISLSIVGRLLFVRRLNEYLDTNVNNTNAMAQILRNLSVSVHREQKSAERSGNMDMSPKVKTVQFSDVLKCEEGFKIFANHLLKEYSVLSI